MDCSNQSLAAFPFPLAPNVTTLTLTNNSLTALEATDLDQLPSLVSLDLRNNAIARVSPEALALLAQLPDLASFAMAGNPSVCGLDPTHSCNCSRSFAAPSNSDGQQLLPGCLPQCPERVPRFHHTRCPSHHARSVCNVSCDSVLTAPGPSVPTRFRFTCSDDGIWHTTASDGGVCTDFLCTPPTSAYLTGEPFCDYCALGGSRSVASCFARWPQGLPTDINRIRHRGLGLTSADIFVNVTLQDLQALTALTRLELTNVNFLPVLPFVFLQTQSQTLTHLDLSNNFLTALPTEALRAFSMVTTLVLSHNIMKRLDLDPILAHPRLETLILNSNVITTIGRASLPRQQQPPSLLRNLNLDFNRIRHIGTALSVLSNLEILTLVGNKLTRLHTGQLPPFAHLRLLNLRDNLISVVDRGALLPVLNWDELDTPARALEANQVDPTTAHPSVLSDNVRGVYMESNPSNCTWSFTTTGSVRLNCNCATGQREVPACPRLKRIPCDALGVNDTLRNGSVFSPDILPAQLCDGHADCPDGADEASCRVELRLGAYGDCDAPLKRETESCFTQLAGNVMHGVLSVEKHINADSDLECDEGRAVLVSATHAVGANGRDVYR